MGDFIETGTLAGPMADAKPLPAGANPNLIPNLQAARWNEHRSALLDLRTHSSGWVNVRSYGAVGDGVTDDTAAIQAAKTALDLGTIRIPKGDYRATSVKLKNKLTYEGDGVEVSTLRLAGAGTLITSDLTNNSYAGLSRLTVRGDGATAGQKLLDLTGPYASYFNEVLFSSAENLVEFSEVEGQTILRDCYLLAAGAGGYALRLDNAGDVTVENTPIENSENGVYATRTNALIRLRFANIHSEDVGRLFNIDTNSANGSVIFRDIVAYNVGHGLADPSTGYAFRVNGELAEFDNVAVVVESATTPVIVTPLWSIYARDCPSFSADDAKVAFIPKFRIGFGNAYVPAVKRSILDPSIAASSLYTVANGAAVTTTGGYGAFSGQGQYRIRPLTSPTLSPTSVANKAIMVRFEYRSTTAATPTLNIDSMGGQMIGYSGSTIARVTNSVQLPSTAGVWTKAYFYIRYTAEFSQSARFFYVNTTDAGDSMDIRAFDIFETDRPPYSLLDW
jgi:hypothetical protein